MIQIPSLIMGFREALEAFLLVAIMLKYVNKLDNQKFKIKIFQGTSAGILLSILLGILLTNLSNQLSNLDAMAKVWESLASLIAICLVSFFIVWMINHGSDLVHETKNQVKKNLSTVGLFLISFIVVSREGVEIAIFTFAGQYSYFSVFIGIGLGLILTLIIFYSLIKINLSLLFKITLAYLILQAGFLLGYAIHEGLSALKAYEILPGSSAIYLKAYDLSEGLLDHEVGSAGLLFHILFGWYSRPEWLQFIAQYLFSLSMFYYWYLHNSKQTIDANQPSGKLSNQN